jgi:hypothetical protein
MLTGSQFSRQNVVSNVDVINADLAMNGLWRLPEMKNS